MIVTFVSQCEKKALSRTRRVLDAYANRIGSNTWQTVITQEGLLAVKKSLRKTATKNTAVSCHWLRSRSRSELVWVVGQRDKFNAEGVVPVNFTQRNLLLSHVENNWQYLPLIQALVAISALFHDWGKASQLFQEKLSPTSKKSFKGDPIRHEWISCLLLRAFIDNHYDSSEPLSDKQWLTALAEGEIDEAELSTINEEKCQHPLSNLPPMAKLIAWLVISHHRLPLSENSNLKSERSESIDDVLALIDQQWGYENRLDEKEYQARIKQCFLFPKGLLSTSSQWQKAIKKWSQRLLDCQQSATTAIQDGSYRVVLHHARLCLMLGDHYYSSQDAAKNWQNKAGLFANTDRSTGELKQALDEHLVGVAKQGLRNAYQLPAFETALPVANNITALKKRSSKGYQWQDKAVDAVKSFVADNSEVTGFFIVNMASTGCGKTFANAKVMRALSTDGDSLRFILALGLRTLTLQTGDEYRGRVGLDDTELAVLIGSRAVTELHQQRKIDEEKESFENTGSLSAEALLDEAINYDCDIPEEGLATLLTNARDRQFLYAPVLACTIDHIMAAIETRRGGRYILPALRLLSSDLVIDEIDDFTGSDLICIGRLIHLAGMLGRKIMISSATISPDIAEGYFKAYRDGWQLHSKARQQNATIASVWIDEFTTQVTKNTALDLKAAIKEYREQHQIFIDKRKQQLVKQEVRRKAIIASCASVMNQHKDNHDDFSIVQNKQAAYFDSMLNQAIDLHHHHHIVDNTTQLAVSFGVIRTANIQPCVALTRYLLNAICPDSVALRVMAYHSRQVLLMRHEQEQHLDQVLKRKEKAGETPQALSNAIIRGHLDSIQQTALTVKHVLFVVVATPVEEVGRDHDFDWAVIEPSSYRSIIQLAGRVRRHRNGGIKEPNIGLMEYNWKGIRNQHKDNIQVFQKPGFEVNKYYLKSHSLNDLLDAEAMGERLDALPRIQKPRPLLPDQRLADLEHQVTKDLLTTYRTEIKNGKLPCIGPATLQGYLREHWFLTALPAQFAPFRQGKPTTKLFLVFYEDDLHSVFSEINDKGELISCERVFGIQRRVLADVEKQRLWLRRDFDCSVESLADEQDTGQRRLSIRYGEICFPYKEGKHYEYCDQLGLVERE